jgi:hypothetical protein
MVDNSPGNTADLFEQLIGSICCKKSARAAQHA